MQNKFCTLALTALLTLGMAGSAAIAQDQSAPPPQQGGQWGHHGMDPDVQLKHMTKALDLTADQQTQIKPILESQSQQMQAIRQDQSLAGEDRMTKMKAIHEDSRTKIEAVLNDQQKQKYEAMQSEMRGHRGGGQQPPPQQ